MVRRDSYFELQHNKTLKILFLILFGTVIAGLVFVFRYFFWPFLFAMLLYMALQPVFNFIMRYIKRRGISSLVMIVLLILIIIIPTIFIIAEVVNQIYHLYFLVETEIKAGTIKDIYNTPYVQEVLNFLNIETGDITSRVSEFIKNITGMALSSAQAVIAYPLSLIINFFFLFLMLFFLFKDGNKVQSIFYKLMPFPDDIEESVVNRMKEVIRVLLTGNLLIMLAQGLMVGIGLFFVDIRLAFLGGSIATIFSLIPVIGTSLVWLPAVIYLIFVESYLKALFLGIWCLAWFLLLENLVKPKVFGERLKFHPVVFFFLLLGSLQAFGLPGIFIGPLLLTLFYSLWEIYRMLHDYDLQNLNENAKSPEV